MRVWWGELVLLDKELRRAHDRAHAPKKSAQTEKFASGGKNTQPSVAAAPALLGVVVLWALSYEAGKYSARSSSWRALWDRKHGKDREKPLKEQRFFGQFTGS